MTTGKKKYAKKTNKSVGLRILTVHFRNHYAFLRRKILFLLWLQSKWHNSNMEYEIQMNSPAEKWNKEKTLKIKRPWEEKTAKILIGFNFWLGKGTISRFSYYERVPFVIPSFWICEYKSKIFLSRTKLSIVYNFLQFSFISCHVHKAKLIESCLNGEWAICEQFTKHT